MEDKDDLLDMNADSMGQTPGDMITKELHFPRLDSLKKNILQDALYPPTWHNLFHLRYDF